MKPAIIIAAIVGAIGGANAAEPNWPPQNLITNPRTLEEITGVPKSGLPKPVEPKPVEKTSSRTVIPPAEFDHPYTDGPVIYHVIDDQVLLKQVCPLIPFPIALGCAQKLASKVCLIFLAPKAVIARTDYMLEIVKRHEIGHCNGWPPNHVPQGRSLKEAGSR
jgi:hypothetical protein